MMLAVGDDEFLTQFDTANRDHMAIRFTRDGEGKISGFTIASERVKGLRFDRIELTGSSK